MMENIMQRSQAQTGKLFVLAQTVQISTLAKLLGWFSGPRESQFGWEQEIAKRYDGRAWCDSMEHQLTNEVMTGIQTRF
jgi:hypothetical protein